MSKINPKSNVQWIKLVLFWDYGKISSDFGDSPEHTSVILYYGFVSVVFSVRTATKSKYQVTLKNTGDILHPATLFSQALTLYVETDQHIHLISLGSSLVVNKW